ncbi:hypothetical protein [Breznakiella homolactica]|uniref:Uncharacterized protein n=1 Tax=Breznakiella homolactica TaxID=2798577 RepID=A0A7T7XK59_9SPIR|nr:hypothetical protein [Breznakiella homolactica]QQO07871.1 hypothetical protein JFL75_13080 [Breznakiella homolactica]
MTKTLDDTQYQEVLDLAEKLQSGYLFMSSTIYEMADNTINCREKPLPFEMYNGLAFILEMMSEKMGDLYRLINTE